MKKILKENWKLFILSLVSGFAFAPIYFIFLLPFALFLVVNKTISAKSKGEAFLIGVIFGFGFFLTQLYWISFSLFVDLKSFFWLVPFAICLIPLASSMFTGFSALLLYFITKKFRITNKLHVALVFAATFVFCEYLKAFLFPWNYISYIWAFSNIIIQIASIFNIYIFDFITIFLLLFIFVIFGNTTKKEKYIYSSIYLFIVFFILTFGIVKIYSSKNETLPINVRVVQANIKQSLKWDPAKEIENLQKHLKLTIEESIDDIDLIIWPESSIEKVMTLDTRLPKELNYIKSKYLIAGGIRAEIKNNQIKKVWNSALIFNKGEMVDYYDKFILVPFGEYIPLANLFPFMRTIAGGGIDFSKGNGNITIDVGGLKISPVICYEIIFPFKVVDKNNRPDVIVNITNDAWFGVSSGPYQHLVAARFRAVENSMPVIRANNSGVSVYIDKYGRVVQKIGLGKSGYFDIK